jgi:predicted dehydrogenase
VHDIDSLLWLCGGRPTLVRASHAQRRWQEAGDLVDTGQVFFRTDEGLTGFVDVNWLTPAKAPWHGDYRLMLNGTHGSATVRYVGRELMVVTERDGLLSLAVPPDENPFDDFARAILTGRRPTVAAADVFLATRFTLLARLSAELDRELKLDEQLHVMDESP